MPEPQKYLSVQRCRWIEEPDCSLADTSKKCIFLLSWNPVPVCSPIDCPHHVLDCFRCKNRYQIPDLQKAARNSTLLFCPFIGLIGLGGCFWLECFFCILFCGGVQLMFSRICTAGILLITKQIGRCIGLAGSRCHFVGSPACFRLIDFHPCMGRFINLFDRCQRMFLA